MRAELPGLERDDITLGIRDHNLVLERVRRFEQAFDEQVYWSERGYGHFRRVIGLPDDVDPRRSRTVSSRSA